MEDNTFSNAGRNGGRSRDAAARQVVDSKPYVRHHPIIGYVYVPNTVQTLPAPGGGQYTIRINSAGLRSDREYSFKKPAGVRRFLVFGDSMAAGQFISNEHRFSEVLERRIPNLEVMNLSLEGSGTDQQLLMFEHVGKPYEFDLVIVFPFLQNIRRNMVDAREGWDPVTLDRILLPKPRFELVNGKLELRNIPVPQHHVRIAAIDPHHLNATDANISATARLKSLISSWPFISPIKRIVYGIVPWEPFPEYKNPDSPEWVLMEALLRRFKELAGDKPMVIVPTFYSNYVRYRMARNYWNRFVALARTPGIFVIDLLPHMMRLGAEAALCYQDPYDMHFSATGNLVLADAIQEELTRLNLLPGDPDARCQ